MILTCSSCATRYLVDPAAIGSSGRDVRCARCGHVWFQQPARDLPMSVEDDPVISDPMAYRPAPNLPALQKPRTPWGLVAGWAMLAGFLAVLGFGLLQFRDRLVTLWPASARLYAALHIPTPGMVLKDVRFARERDGEVALLTVSGAIVNAASAAAPAPRVRISLRDGIDRELAHQEIEGGERSLGPGAEVRFTARLTDPPPEARNVEIRLVGP
jgi:predicted Zn finger-like uncharacterized protein